MCWIKRDMWKACVAVVGLLIVLALMIWIPASEVGAYEGVLGVAATVTVQTTPTVDATVTELNKEKLQHENDWWWSNGATILTSVLSILALAAAGIFTVVRYFNDRRDAREKQEEEAKRLAEDRQAERERRDEEQQRWLKDKEVEREKRAEERFQEVVEGLGSEREEARVGAAITLRTFLLPGYEQFYRQAFDLAVAHLRLRKAQSSTLESPSSPISVLIIPKGDMQQKQQLPPSTAPIPLDSLSQALITVFKEAFPLARNELKKKNAQFDPQLLDATNIRLDNAYLVDADLAEAWLWQASLRQANLGGAQLKGANLIGAHLEGANLKKVQFEGANLNYAHCKGADLKGANVRRVAHDGIPGAARKN